jgi:hypothetical protein
MEREDGIQGRLTGAESDPEDPAHRVQDLYVARRVAEHFAATEAERRHSESQLSSVAAAASGPFGFYVLLGLVVASLLLLIISVSTGIDGQPGTVLRTPPTLPAPAISPGPPVFEAIPETTARDPGAEGADPMTPGSPSFAPAAGPSSPPNPGSSPGSASPERTTPTAPQSAGADAPVSNPVPPPPAGPGSDPGRSPPASPTLVVTPGGDLSEPRPRRGDP